MKKIMVLLVVALFISPFLLLCVPKARAAENWKQCGQTDMGTFYYDANSIRRFGDVIQVGTVVYLTPTGINSAPQALEKADHFFELIKINCRDKTLTEGRTILYDADDSKIADLPPDPNVIPINPGSVMESLSSMVCLFWL